MSSELDLKEAVDQELQRRKGIYGEDMPKLVAYLKKRLGLECSNSQLESAVNSLIHERKLVRKRFKPRPVAVSVTRGEEGVIIYHSDYKNAPESDFPPEFGEFLSKHHQLAKV